MQAAVAAAPKPHQPLELAALVVVGMVVIAVPLQQRVQLILVAAEVALIPLVILVALRAHRAALALSLSVTLAHSAAQVAQ